MEVIALLLGAYKVGRALMKGDGADTATGDLVATFLRPLLQGQDQSLQALERIEATLGRVEQQAHVRAMHVGLDTLRDATVSQREGEERTHLLRAALQEFRAGVATAPDTRSAVNAQMLVAACWIARGGGQDALAAMAAAAVRCRDDMYRETREYAQPSGAVELMRGAEGAGSRLRRLMAGGVVGYDDPGLSSARARLRAAAAERRNAVAALYNQVQQVRSTFGERSAACAPVMGFYEPGEKELSPRHAPKTLGISAWMNNAPVLSWIDGQPIDLVGVTLESAGSPVVQPTDGGYRTEFRLAAQLGVPEVKLAVSPSWPYDYHPDPIHSSRVIGRSLLTTGLFWNGAAVGVAVDSTFRVQCTTAFEPTRIVAQQYGIMVDGTRNSLIACMQL